MTDPNHDDTLDARGAPEMQAHARPKVLIVLGLASLLLCATTLGGMGRDVGGEVLVTAYTFFWAFVWPASFFLMSARLDDPNGSRRLRRMGYASAPVLHSAIVFWMPIGTWERLGWKEVWFNYFGETLVYTRCLEVVLLTAISAFVLERSARPGRTASAGAA